MGLAFHAGQCRRLKFDNWQKTFELDFIQNIAKMSDTAGIERLETELVVPGRRLPYEVTGIV
ncbi:hypothetical protein [Nitratireductor sp. GCM10026969]|uniref:hypothetical protein n=1 Tax=Nitratireductor sp. GCM10026969 TaxID=3252645 RepID=UPI00360C55A1